ncbi:MAG: S-ribosylhomocysteine lyase [Bacteroidales bacterium]
MEKVESFELDHRLVKAPYLRKCCVQSGEKGDQVTKFDVRFLQPNREAFGTAAMHGLEHLLAHELRGDLPGVIDLSPMGCRTGFYLTLWGDREPAEVKKALESALTRILDATEIPAANEIQCGNYRDLSLFGAKEYAKDVLKTGFSLDIFGEQFID